MFNDRNKELQRLEQALWEEEPDLFPEEEECPEDEDLLAEETLDALLADMTTGKDSFPYQNYSNAYGSIYNTDVTEEDLEDYAEEVLEEPKASYNGLITLACLLAIGILGMVIFLLLKGRGIL